MKVLFLHYYDSYYKSLKILKTWCEESGFDVTSQLWSRADSHSILTESLVKSKEELEGQSHFFGYDVIVAGLGGKDLNILIASLLLPTSVSRPRVVSLFPGVVHNGAMESFITRSWADVILVNCQKDYWLCQKIMKWQGGKNQVVNAGALWAAPSLMKNVKILKEKRNKVVFFEQATVPYTLQERSFLCEMLMDFAIKNHGYELVIKLRQGGGLEQPHKASYCLSNIIATSDRIVPSNLKFSYDSVENEINDAHACITIASSAAYESLLNKIPTFFLSDFGIHGEYGNDLFLKSNLMVKLQDVKLNGCHNVIANDKWLSDVVFSPLVAKKKVMSAFSDSSNAEHFKLRRFEGVGFIFLFFMGKIFYNERMKFISFSDFKIALTSRWKIFNTRYKC